MNVFLAKLNSALDVTLIWINVLNVKKDFTLAKVCADHVQVSAKSVQVLISALYATRINQL